MGLFFFLSSPFDVLKLLHLPVVQFLSFCLCILTVNGSSYEAAFRPEFLPLIFIGKIVVVS